MTTITTDHIVKSATDEKPFPTLWEVLSVKGEYVTAKVIPASTIPVIGFYKASKWRIVPPEEQVIPCGCEREGCEGTKRYTMDPFAWEIHEEVEWDFWCEIDLDERRDEI